MAFIFDIETGPLPADELEAAIAPMLESEPFPEMVPFNAGSVKTGNITKDMAKKEAKIAEAEKNGSTPESVGESGREQGV